MGEYINPENDMFQKVLNSQIYVDKTEMLAETNKVLDTEQQFIYISRPRRFGKSIAAKMLAAYYSCGCNSKEIFANLKIAKDHSFEKYLNQYNVIFINMVDFWSETKNVTKMLALLQNRIICFLLIKLPHLP